MGDLRLTVILLSNGNGAIYKHPRAISLQTYGTLKPATTVTWLVCNRGVLRARQGDDLGAVADFQKYLDVGGAKGNGDQAEVEERIRKLQEKT